MVKVVLVASRKTCMGLPEVSIKGVASFEVRMSVTTSRITTRGLFTTLQRCHWESPRNPRVVVIVPKRFRRATPPTARASAPRPVVIHCHGAGSQARASLAVRVVRARPLLQPRVVGEAAKGGDTRRAPSLAQRPGTRIWTRRHGSST